MLPDFSDTPPPPGDPHDTLIDFRCVLWGISPPKLCHPEHKEWDFKLLF